MHYYESVIVGLDPTIFLINSPVKPATFAQQTRSGNDRGSNDIKRFGNWTIGMYFYGWRKR